MSVKREVNLVVVGNRKVGRTNISSTFTGTDRESSFKRLRFSEQMIVKKEHDITTNARIIIKGAPRDYGRAPNIRLREDTFKEAQGYIVVFHNTQKKEKDKFPFEWYIRSSEKKPTLMIGTTIDGNTKKNPDIENYALSVGATYVVIDTTKLSDKVGEDFKLMERSICNLVFNIFGEPLLTDDIAEKKVEAEKKPEEKVEEKVEFELKTKLPFINLLDNASKMSQKTGEVA